MPVMTGSAAQPKFDACSVCLNLWPAVLHIVWMLFPSALHIHICRWAASPFRDMQRRVGKPLLSLLTLLSPSKASALLNPHAVWQEEGRGNLFSLRENRSHAVFQSSCFFPPEIIQNTFHKPFMFWDFRINEPLAISSKDWRRPDSRILHEIEVDLTSCDLEEIVGIQRRTRNVNRWGIRKDFFVCFC